MRCINPPPPRKTWEHLTLLMRKWAQLQQQQQQHRRSPQLAKAEPLLTLLFPLRVLQCEQKTRVVVSQRRRKAVKKAEELVVASCFFVRRLVIPERRAEKRRPSLLWQDWRRTENHNTRAAVQTTPLPPRAPLWQAFQPITELMLGSRPLRLVDPFVILCGAPPSPAHFSPRCWMPVHQCPRPPRNSIQPIRAQDRGFKHSLSLCEEIF